MSNCHFCGGGLGIAALTAADSDFCSKDHRSEFESRLKKALALLRRECPDSLTTAAPIIAFKQVASAVQPASRACFQVELRLPTAGFAIVPDPLPDAAPVLTFVQPIDQVPPAAELEARDKPTGIRMPKLDRIVALGSRLRHLRSQLDRASDVQNRLATA